MDYVGKTKQAMNIWIDILHIPQLNFYKPLIKRLSQEGHHVYVTLINRGKQVNIAKKEIGNLNNVYISAVGHHRMNKLSVILEANILRFIQLYFWSRKKQFDVVLTNGYLASYWGKKKGARTYSFGDDPQTKVYKFQIAYNTTTHYCTYEYNNSKKLSPQVKILPVLKEWAYLNPLTFTPNPKILEKYHVLPKDYIFLREVTVGTANYSGQKEGAILAIKNQIPTNLKVLFSLEEKQKRNLYPKEWVLLHEPLEDIHSLIYYSAGLISSGDSMAREAAILGTNSYYLGIRKTMPANLAATKIAGLNNTSTMPLQEWFKLLQETQESLTEKQETTRTKINNLFIDVNEYMYNLILEK